MSFGRFFGGLLLPAMKPEPGPVERLPPPAQLRVPLLQHAGVAAEACVAVGERVARFQRIGRVPDGALGAAVHTPAAGVVVGWERGPVALPGTPEAWHVVIAVAANGPELRLPPLDPVAAPIAALRILLADKPARAAREPGAARKPREGTKQEQVLAMLRRPEGATVAQIADATGWAQHYAEVRIMPM